VRVEYDPNRSSSISLILYSNGLCAYIIHPFGLSVGSTIASYTDVISAITRGLVVQFMNGDSCYVRNIPLGTILHNVEKFPGSGGAIARSAGTFRLLLKRFLNLRKCLIKIPSGDLVTISFHCGASKGIVSNRIHRRCSIGKAGRNRLLGLKPIVRGVAKNPIDHPHGGGEGKKSKKCFPRTA
jgi:large subunit ribosomal protein L2